MSERATAFETVKALEEARGYCTSDAYVDGLREFTQADKEIEKLKKRFQLKEDMIAVLIIVVVAALLLHLAYTTLYNVTVQLDRAYCAQYPEYVTVDESGTPTLDTDALKAAAPEAYDQWMYSLLQELGNALPLFLITCAAIIAAGVGIGYVLCGAPKVKEAQGKRLAPYIERKNQGAAVCVGIYNEYAEKCARRNEYQAVSWEQFDIETIDMLLAEVQSMRATTIPECWARIEHLQAVEEAIRQQEAAERSALAAGIAVAVLGIVTAGAGAVLNASMRSGRRR